MDLLGGLLRLRSPTDRPDWHNPVYAETCVERARLRFASKNSALQYPAGHRKDLKGHFERKALMHLLDRLPNNAHVLDLPCGTGRVMRLLLDRGYTVTGGDCSEHMVERCRENMLSEYAHVAHRIELSVRDVMTLDYPDRSFDAVVCNRLLHHFDDSAQRILALRELARVSRGPVIASFNQNGTLSGLRRRIRNAVTAKPQMRLPSRDALRTEYRKAGLDHIEIHQVIPGMSRMCYIVGRPAA